MKTLLLMRHGTAGWDPSDVPDHERRLTRDGRDAAAKVAADLAAGDLRPDRIFTSTATRTLETARIVAGVFRSPPPILARRALYLADPARCVAVLAGCPDESPTLCLVGHNPGLAQVVTRLAGENVSFSPACCVEIAVSIEVWSALEASSGAKIVTRRRP
ncbi:MAG: histidine phosphatase family protein [Acidobacteriota bacterium]